MRNIIYTKYSNDRNKQFRIRTSIYENREGIRSVEKIALTKQAEHHIEKIQRNYELLVENYKNNKVSMNKCKMKKTGIEFEYLDGLTLEEELDAMMINKDYNEVIQTIQEYAKVICDVKYIQNFKSTPQFEKVFGKVSLSEKLKAGAISNIDVIFSNIIVSEKWNIIDYEWTFDFPVPFNYIIYRAVLGYIYSNPARIALASMGIYELLGITEYEIQEYEKMAIEFNKYVWGKPRGNEQIYEKMLQENIPVREIQHYNEEYNRKNEIQVFYDYGQGMSEKDSYRFTTKPDSNGYIGFCIAIENKSLKSIRLDPANHFCIVDIEYLIKDSNKYGYEVSCINAININEHNILFLTNDPQIILSGIKTNMSKIDVLLKVQILDKDIANGIGQMVNQKNESITMLARKNEQTEQLKSVLENRQNDLEKENSQFKKYCLDLKEQNVALQITNTELAEKVDQKKSEIRRQNNLVDQLNIQIINQKEGMERFKQEKNSELEYQYNLVEQLNIQVINQKEEMENFKQEKNNELEYQHNLVGQLNIQIVNQKEEIECLKQEKKITQEYIYEVENTKVWKMYTRYRKLVRKL